METLQHFYKNVKLREALHSIGLIKGPLLILLLFVCSIVYSQNNLIVSGTTLKVGNSMVLISNDAKLNSSSNLLIQGSGILKLNGNLLNNSGSLEDLTGGKVAFTGNNNSTISGANAIIFNNLEINKDLSSNIVTLNVNINVGGILTMTSGDLDVANSVVNLGTTGSIVGESNSNRIKAANGGAEGSGSGYLVANKTLNSGLNANLAGLGIDITTNSYTGLRSITRFPSNISGVNYFTIDDGNCANRTFYLPDFGTATANHFLDISYFQEEEFNCNQAPIINPINLNNSYFVSFDASKESQGANLIWKVYGVLDMTQFVLESSLDNDIYTPISSFDELGIPKKINSFQFKDLESIPENSFKYYRLKQLNVDGTIKIHGPIRVMSDGLDYFKAYLTKSENLRVEFYAPKLGDYRLKYLNANGQIVYESVLNAVEGYNTYEILLPKTTYGIYLINLFNDEKFYSVKIINMIK